MSTKLKKTNIYHKAWKSQNIYAIKKANLLPEGRSMKLVATFVFLILGISSQSLFAAGEVDFFESLVGNHSLNGGEGCNSIDIEVLKDNPQNPDNVKISISARNLYIYDKLNWLFPNEKNTQIKGNSLSYQSHNNSDDTFDSWWTGKSKLKVNVTKDEAGNLLTFSASYKYKSKFGLKYKTINQINCFMP